MSLSIRRVVTGHHGQGRAKVMIDETVKNVAAQRPGAVYSVIWSTVRASRLAMTATMIRQARRSAPRSPTGPFSASSASDQASRHAIIVPIRSITRW
jgi:hypothetical protein